MSSTILSTILILLVVWNMFYFPIHSGFLSSSQLTLIFFRGVQTNHQMGFHGNLEEIASFDGMSYRDFIGIP